ncbi:histidine phosphatase family protein [Photobacterium lucens]|uniref:histidine phosphatase family protein n=1 Tax=Photobacterium lucens TaxID=2562949 RepID=UPI0006B5E7D0|nr:histidine phosphatase family protein [Photobacterium lucens]KPA51595.1 histidine phosphatase [Photobacterium leiognathi subsp. mandapamensis]MBP2701157.1 histidine phosphatase family protein [Vibrio parahaemolyticus]MZG55443.1 histidine phosphatase family protein [Photobacterium lucens]MZG80630.1 histidine phosphatase family protein [Photobacterium lucens]
MSKSIFLLRHGQTTFNAQQRLQGHCNSELTALGQTQAATLGASLNRKIANKKQWTVYSSPLGRALETAQIVCTELGIDSNSIITDERLKEFNLGDWEMCFIPDLVKQNPKLLNHRDWYLSAPHCESYESVVTRVKDFLDDDTVPDHVIVISHGLTGAVFRGVYTAMSYSETFEQDLPQNAYFLLADDKLSRIQCEVVTAEAV